jgi:hypothetical protein
MGWGRLTPNEKSATVIGAVAGLILSIFVSIGFGNDWPWWSKYLGIGKTPLGVGVSGFSGGCDAFQIFAQNRWQPYGTVMRAQPNVLSKQVGGFSPNQSIAVNGWVHSRPAYPTNSAPWNSDAWFHLADQSGWVSFAGVRATTTTEDPTGLGEGGPPAATSKFCEGSVT